MTQLKIDVNDIGISAVSGDTIRIYSPRFREWNGKIISTAPLTIPLDKKGTATREVAPGDMCVEFRCRNFKDSREFPVVIPDRDEPVTLADLLRDSFTFAEPVVSEIGRIRDAVQKLSDAAGVARRGADAAVTKILGLQKDSLEALERLRDFVSKTQEKVAADAAVVDDSKRAALNAATSAESFQSMAAASEGKAQAALEGLQAKLEAWKPQAEQLEKWQPQYEWLKENAASGFSKITEMMQDAASNVRGELAGLVEQARTAQSTAGQHSLKAQAAAKDAESVATRIVDSAITKLKGNAPELLDTLGELAERVKSGGTLEAEIIQKLSAMADSETVRALASKLENLTISSIRGLSEALASKAPLRHSHSQSDVLGLSEYFSNIQGMLLQKAEARHGHGTSEISGLDQEISNIKGQLAQKIEAGNLGSILSRTTEFTNIDNRLQQISRDVRKIEIVSSLPTRPDSETIYMVRE